MELHDPPDARTPARTRPSFLGPPGGEHGRDDDFAVGHARVDRDGERATLSVPEAARLIGISRNAAYAAARAGTLPVWRIGNRILVLRRPLEAMLAGGSR